MILALSRLRQEGHHEWEASLGDSEQSRPELHRETMSQVSVSSGKRCVNKIVYIMPVYKGCLLLHFLL